MSELREGIFRLHTRRFGTVAELLVKKLINARESNDAKYDLESDGTRIECKFSRAWQKSQVPVSDSTVMEAIYEQVRRDISYEDCEDRHWDCNFQQIKKDLFDVMMRTNLTDLIPILITMECLVLGTQLLMQMEKLWPHLMPVL